MQASGVRLANNKEVTPNNLTAVSAYVQQDDLFIGTLTVKEHLTFQVDMHFLLTRTKCVGNPGCLPVNGLVASRCAYSLQLEQN